MLTKEVKDLLMDQINKELYSAYLYLDFANYYETEGLDGFAHWYEVQADEEVEHATKIRRYLIDCGEKVTLEAIAKPDKVFKDVMEPLKAGLAHEQYVSSLIHAIYGAALKAADYRTMEFLTWFISEQGEEETNASNLISKAELCGGDKKNLYHLNEDLASRK